MKVLLTENIAQLGQIGDVVDVKPGYARNYLLPHGHATEPTVANLRAIEEKRKRWLEELARRKAELEALARTVDGKEVTISARANEEGHLYGSVGPAQVASALAAIGHNIDAERIHLDEPIRQLDRYDVQLRFGEGVTAGVVVWVVPLREEGEGASESDAATGESPQ